LIYIKFYIYIIFIILFFRKKVEEKIIKVDEDDDDLNYDFANDKDLNDSDSIKNLEREILKENMEIAEKRELERGKILILDYVF